MKAATASPWRRLTARPEWQFFGALRHASPGYAVTWWCILVLNGILPAATSVLFGWLINSFQHGESTTAPLVAVGAAFTLMLVLQPLLLVVSSNLGSRMASHLYDRLMVASTAPQGIGHLERADLANDLTMAREFDQGMLGPPLTVSMDFIASGLTELVVGVSAAIVLTGYHWWAGLGLAIAWGCTHWLLRETGVWKDRNTTPVRTAQRHAEYAYRLAVDPGPAKELRYFGLAGWVTDRFITMRRRLYDLQYEATRLREKSVTLCLLIVAAANVGLFWLIGHEASNGDLTVAKAVVFAQSAIGVGAIAFGGLSWALDGAAAPVAAMARLEAAMAPAGALMPGAGRAVSADAPRLAFRGVRFAYPQEAGRAVLDGIDLEIPAGTSLAIVGQNGAGKTTLAKLVCRLYDPTSGAIEADGVPLTDLDIGGWRRHVTAVFQDFVRFELSVGHNVAPRGNSTDDDIRGALRDAGAGHLADGSLGMILSKAYPGGTDLSGGQWQRVALARALCAVRGGARVVLLDEPTAQLDVRGEAEIFRRVLEATRGCTVILISHRFSTVRLADRIAVVEQGMVVEQGTHDELMALGGRYHTMFQLQASRFAGEAGPRYDEEGEEVRYEVLD